MPARRCFSANRTHPLASPFSHASECEVSKETTQQAARQQRGSKNRDCVCCRRVHTFYFGKPFCFWNLVARHTALEVYARLRPTPQYQVKPHLSSEFFGPVAVSISAPTNVLKKAMLCDRTLGSRWPTVEANFHSGTAGFRRGRTPRSRARVAEPSAAN